MPDIKKILLPIDVTHPHPEFLPLLNELVPLSGAQVLLLYVKEEWPAMEHRMRTLAHSADELDRSVNEKAGKVLEEIKVKVEQFGAAVKTEIVGGPAAAMIEAVARDEGYNMTALTPGSPQSVDKFMLGRVSARVVRHAPGMVLLLRGPLPEKIDHVVIGLDGSQPALDAMTMAAHLFSFHEKATKITLVSVVSISRVFTMFSPVEYVSALESNLKMTSEALLAEGEKVLAQLAIKNVEMKLTEGHTAEELIKVANELGAGLIVVGSQGKDAIKHFIMGSTSSTLATHANCPVAVFKGDHA